MATPKDYLNIKNRKAMNEEPQNSTPNFYAIIPADVRYNKDLCPNAKLLYSEITALSNQQGYCWASNKYFANLYDVDERTVKRWLKDLENFGYIEIETKKVGFQWDRKIFLKNVLRRDKNVPTRGQKCPDRRDKNVPIIVKENTIKKNNNSDSIESPQASSEAVVISSQISLLEEHGIKKSEAVREGYDAIPIEELKEHIESALEWQKKNKRIPKLQALRKALKGKWKLKEKTEEEENIEWTERNLRKFHGKANKNKAVIEICKEEVEFSFIGKHGARLSEFVRYTDKGFQKSVAKLLKELGYWE